MVDPDLVVGGGCQLTDVGHPDAELPGADAVPSTTVANLAASLAMTSWQAAPFQVPRASPIVTVSSGVSPVIWPPPSPLSPPKGV